MKQNVRNTSEIFNSFKTFFPNRIWKIHEVYSTYTTCKMYTVAIIALAVIVLIFFMLHLISKKNKDVTLSNDIILDNTFRWYPELYQPLESLLDVGREAKNLGFTSNEDGLQIFKANYKGVWDSHVPLTREVFGNLPVKKASFFLIPPGTVRRPRRTGRGHTHILLLTENPFGSVGIWVEGRFPEEDEKRYYAGTRFLKYMSWVTYDAGQHTSFMNRGEDNAIYLELTLENSKCTHV